MHYFPIHCSGNRICVATVERVLWTGFDGTSLVTLDLMITCFWDVGYLLHPEDEGAEIFRNVGNCLPVDMA